MGANILMSKARNILIQCAIHDRNISVLDKLMPDWPYNLPVRYDLSEDFIRAAKDRIDWEQISYSQNLNTWFILEFKDRLRYPYATDDYHLTRKIGQQKLLVDISKVLRISIPWMLSGFGLAYVTSLFFK